MSRFLDPKADLTFKKVFGEHKHLVMSLLNALLPLEEGRQVESIEYLQPEMTPRTPFSKGTIVDVRCEDTGGRKFIVEMQMNWRANYEQRAIFNAAKAEMAAEREAMNATRVALGETRVALDAATVERNAAVEKLRRAVRQMQAGGMSAEMIATFTGLADAEIEGL